MKLLSRYTYFVFILLLVNAIILELFLAWGERHWRIFGLNTFNFIVVVYSPLVISLFFVIPFSEKIKENKNLLFIILVYALYQIAFNLPMTLTKFAGHVGVKFISELSLRLSLLQIPLFYWFIFRNSSEEKLLRLFDITALLMVIFGIYNYTQGQYNITNTGEIRTVSGVVAMYCFIMLFNNLKFLGAKNNNIFLIFVSLLGIILSVHRSVYITVVLVLLLYILMRYKGFGKFKVALRVGLVIMILGSLALLIPGVADLFISRVENITDTRDYNYYDRTLKNILAYEMFLKYPVNGTYLTGFYYEASAVREEFFWRPHNFIFEILPTQGIIGLIFIFVILFLIFRIAWKNIEDKYTERAFFILLYYVLIALTNASFFYNSCTVVLTFFTALVLWRNKILTEKTTNWNKLKN